MTSTMTDAERAERREQKRQAAEAALDELLTQEGWATWLRLRRNLHGYSFNNQVLIAVQAAQMGFEPTLVKASWRWKRDGYHPAKGSRALVIWVYKSRRRKDKTWGCCGQTLRERSCPSCNRPDHYFQLGPTFDASQVRSFETGEPPVIEIPEPQPVDGNDPGGALLGPLAQWAEDAMEGVAAVNVGCEPHPSTPDAGGWWDPKVAEVSVVQHDSPNHMLRVLIHELAHASGISSRNPQLELSYAEAEVAVECVSYIVASTLGLDTSSEAIPYMAGWGGEQARDKVRALASLIDATAKTIEDAALAILAEPESVVA